LAHAEIAAGPENPGGLAPNRIVLTTEYRERDLVKAIPGARWHNDERYWHLPLSWASCVVARAVFGPALTVGPELNAWAAREQEERVLPALQLREQQDFPANGMERLYPFQRVGAAFLVTAKRALLGDEMGTGKTVQAIAAMQVAGTPALVVCPNSMKLTWAQELAVWAPSVQAHVIKGGAAGRRKQFAAAQAAIDEGQHVAVIVNWEQLKEHSRVGGWADIKLTDKEKEPKELNAFDWRTVIADEAHRGKEPRSKQTRALWAVAAGAEYVWALTGTPVANTPEDLWSIMHLVAPEEYPSKTAWVDRYGLTEWNYFGGMDVVGLKGEHKEELFRYLDSRFLRRTKEQVLPQLPPKTYQRRWVTMAPKQAKAYKQLKERMLADLESGVLIASDPLSKATRLLQFASAYGELTEDDRLVLTAPSCKADAMLEVAEEMGGRPCVVFAESRQLIELTAVALGKAGYSLGQVTGHVTADERQANVERFQQGHLQFLLLTLGAGGEGLTLTAADTAVFLQGTPSLIKRKQAEDRLHRIGQEAEAVTIIDLIAEETVELGVYETVTVKEGRLEEVARDADNLRRWLESGWIEPRGEVGNADE
jgi:SNF2 family DNA or RNA helicase